MLYDLVVNLYPLSLLSQNKVSVYTCVMYGIESGWFRQKIKTKFKNWARSLHFSAMTSITQEPRLMRVCLVYCCCC
jgi:hypothetical protein